MAQSINGFLVFDSPVYRGNSKKTIFTRGNSQQDISLPGRIGGSAQAMMSAFFFYFPAVLLSGFMFPIANMPTVVQWLTFANPLRYFLVIIRGIFLKGVGLPVLWEQMAALAVLGVAMLGLASLKFKKTLA